MANELKQVYGSQTTNVSFGAGALASAANSVAADATQLDNTLNYPRALAMLSLSSGFATAPTAGGTVDLYMVRDAVDSTNDETPIPASGDIDYLAQYVGSFVMDNQTGAVRKEIVIDLTGVKKARFFVKNNTSVSINSGTNVVKITPFSFAPT
jgi:hypothetical protein